MAASNKPTTSARPGSPDGAQVLRNPRSLSRLPSFYIPTFLLLAAVAAGVIWHDLDGAYRRTLADWNVRLSTAAEARVRTANLWRNERRMDIGLVMRDPSTVRLLSTLPHERASTAIKRDAEKELEAVKEGYGYLAGAALDIDCQVAVQSGVTPQMLPPIRAACELLRQRGDFRVDSFLMEEGHLTLTLSAPVFANPAASPPAPAAPPRVGAVVMVSDPWKDLTPLLAFESTPSPTSETLFVWRNGGEALIFLPRFQAQGAKAFFRRPLDAPILESRVARETNVPFGEFTDYRGVRVFAAARQIASDRDSLVRKVDRAEALAGFRRRVVLEGLTGGLAVLLLGSVMVAHDRRAAARGLEEKVKQQQALLEIKQQAEASEERFRKVFEEGPFGMTIIDLNSRFLNVNQAFCSMLGYTKEELTGRTFAEITHPEDVEKNRDLTQQAFQGSIPSFRFEKRYVAKDGRIVWANLAAALIRDSEGRILHGLGMLEDITERKRAEEELRLSEEKFAKAFRASPAALSLSRFSDGRLLEVNDTFLSMFEYKREEVIGKTSLELNLWVDPGDRTWLVEELQRSGRTRNKEIRHWSSSGRMLNVLSSAETLDLGGVPCLLATFVDITQAKEAQEALRLSEHRYRDFISHSNEGVWRVELEQPIPVDLPVEESVERFLRYGYLAECNQAQARNLGFASTDDLIGKRLGDLISSSDEERLDSFRSAVRGGWQNRTVEFQGRDREGNPKFLLRTETPIVEQDRLVRVWGITRDLTELKRAEEQVHHAFEQLRALAARLQNIREEERKRVAREIHDELGQALTAIKIDLISLIRDLPPGSRPPEPRTEALLKLVDGTILAVRRISTDLRPGILDDLGLVATVEWAGEEFEARTGTRCQLTLPPDDLDIDPERATAVFRIFQETLTNVARHAEASAVEVRLTEEGGDLILEVHDNGKGIPEERLSTGRSLGILGMRERAVLLGGDLTIRGIPGAGTTVSVRIPEARTTG